jgi:small subunit ribosomal protein S7
MSRRHRAEKRKPQPDPLYNSFVVQMLINKVMNSGKKSIARKIVYSAISKFMEKTATANAIEAFETALENAKPSLEVKSRRIGGATYQVPVEISPERRTAMAMSWIIKNAQTKSGKSMIDGLAIELADCYKNQGSTIKKKDDLHKMAEANKAFAHYKW